MQSDGEASKLGKQMALGVIEAFDYAVTRYPSPEAMGRVYVEQPLPEDYRGSIPGGLLIRNFGYTLPKNL